MGNMITLILMVVFVGITMLNGLFFYRKKTEIKVLKEEMLELKEKKGEQDETIKWLIRTIPLELYEKVIQEERGEKKIVPLYQAFTIMEMNTAKFDKQVKGMELKETFQVINDVLGKTVPLVYQKQGIIEYFHKAGFVALFEESTEKALEAAISISQVIETEVQSVEESYLKDFSMGLTSGMVLAGMAGTEQRLSLVTVSDFQEVAGVLQILARKYDARILITGTLRMKINGFEKKFHARKIGYIYIKATQTLEEMYDVFDGDNSSTRKNKQKTKIVFENGVEFYAKGDYEKARQYFIEVCKTNRYDGAAKEYLMRCETKLSDIQKLSLEPQIEEI